MITEEQIRELSYNHLIGELDGVLTDAYEQADYDKDESITEKLEDYKTVSEKITLLCNIIDRECGYAKYKSSKAILLRKGELFSGFLGAYARAMRLLGNFGIMGVEDDDGGRGVLGKWKVNDWKK